MHCKYCGYELKRGDSECPNCKHILEMSEVSYTKKSNNLVFIILIVLLLGIIGGGYYYVSRPQVIFNLFLNKVYKEVNSEVPNYKQVKTNLDLNVNVEMSDEYKDITDIINNFKISSMFNLDLENKKFAMGLSADYNNKLLASADMYYEKDKAYIDLNNLFNKLIEVDVDEENEEINITEEDVKVVISSIFNATKKSVEVAEYSNEKIELNGSNVNKSTLIINENNKTVVLDAFVEYLISDNEFITVISKLSEMSIEDVITQISSLKEEIHFDEEIHFSIYTNEFLKLEVGTGEEVKILCTKINNKEFKMEMNDIEGTKINATIKDMGNNKINIIYNIQSEEIKLVVTMNISYVFNEKIQMPVTKEVVSMDELTDEDANSIMEKVMENEGIKDIIETITSLMPDDNYDEEYDGEYYPEYEF